VTIDAIGCQREISRRIVEKKGDYVLCLKGNQPELHADVSLYLDDAIERKAEELDTYSTSGKGHGRIEHRKTWATTDVSWLQKRHDWPGLESIAAVEIGREQPALDARRRVRRGRLSGANGERGGEPLPGQTPWR